MQIDGVWRLASPLWNRIFCSGAYSLREFVLGMILKRDERSCYHGADLGGSRSRGVDKSGISFSVRNPNLNKLSAAATLATAVFYFGYAEFFLKLCQEFCE